MKTSKTITCPKCGKETPAFPTPPTPGSTAWFVSCWYCDAIISAGDRDNYYDEDGKLREQHYETAD